MNCCSRGVYCDFFTLEVLPPTLSGTPDDDTLGDEVVVLPECRENLFLRAVNFGDPLHRVTWAPFDGVLGSLDIEVEVVDVKDSSWIVSDFEPTGERGPFVSPAGHGELEAFDDEGEDLLVSSCIPLLLSVSAWLDARAKALSFWRVPAESGGTSLLSRKIHNPKFYHKNTNITVRFEIFVYVIILIILHVARLNCLSVEAFYSILLYDRPFASLIKDFDKTQGNRDQQ